MHNDNLSIIHRTNGKEQVGRPDQDSDSVQDRTRTTVEQTGDDALQDSRKDGVEDSQAVPREFPDSMEVLLDQSMGPVTPDHGYGRLFRVFAGIREPVLDWVPEERPRYTRLGLVILNTGVLAGLSLFTALDHIVDAPMVGLAVVALFWGCLVLGIDGYLIATTHGALGRTKFLMFVPRLAVSLLLGAVIAEPLLLWVFQPAIAREVRTLRQDEIDHSVTMWEHCNPTTGISSTAAACNNYILTIPASNSPQEKVKELDRLQGERLALNTRIAKINNQLDKMNETARRECNGTTGSGLSGEVGVGPNCRRNRQEADQFRRDSNLPGRQKQLSRLDDRIAALNSQIQESGSAYESDVEATITKATQDLTATKGGDVGLLEESSALESLSAKSSFVFFAQWTVRALLILLDCTPVLAKVIGRTSTYDRLIHAQLNLRRRMHERDSEYTLRAYVHRKRQLDEMQDNEVRAERARQWASERREIEDLIAASRGRPNARS